ncbi:Monocarboxylate transporter 14 isoform 3 [Schistosoma japonicum]|uniref:Monocarboxylate transporter 14 isoform 3 n=1 Tax=Schistosoma japonicum TaxID=6182 RepID=A0A4Z2CTF8_SCHJA|nr:Monocarboxylate transporter 14 isoform 3 [Schistosoma japonicum]TNN07547.1 Monocarboxylate transporter 14 isoform 3 [Schistosoma japonicum]
MATLCVYQESSAPVLPVQQFYIGSEDSHGTSNAMESSTVLSVYQTKHSISSDEPVVSTPTDYIKQKPVLYSQPVVTDVPLQPSLFRETAIPNNAESQLSTNFIYQPNQPSRTTCITVENPKPPSEPTTNNLCGIPDKGGYEINEDFWREPAPNGDWGWLVALGSFLCIFTVDGVCFTYGLHINEMIHYGVFGGNQNDSDKSQRNMSLAMLSLPGALLCGMYFLFGPLTGALVNCFEYRIIASIGAIITSLCFLISALFIHNLVAFTVVFGIIGGIGCSLVYLPAVTIVGHWFEEYRALIVGIVMCGGCLGAGVMAIITPYLASHFLWRGSLILIGGLFSQTLVGIALFRPVSVHENIKAIKLLKSLKKKPLKQKKHKLTWLLSSYKSKHHPERKIAIQRGSIMARIIEEKSRQRTTSTGSLDGMVITRENELVALSSDAYEVVMAAAAVYSANTSNVIAVNTQQTEQSKIQNNAADINQVSSESSFEQIKPSTSMSTNSNSLRYSVDSNRKNLQTLTEGYPMSSFDHPTEKFQTNPQLPCIAVLPPPVQFSRAAVRRIARAILRKLHGQSKISFSPSVTSISIGSRQVMAPSSRLSGDNRIDSCTHFSIPYTNSSRNVQYDRVSQVYRYDLFHGSVATNICRKKRSTFVSSLYSELASNNKDPESSISPVRHLSTAVNRSISSHESHIRLKLPTPDSPSGLTSLISLDSYTGRIISRELNSLLLDQATKLAILNDIRRELSRPKYRPDFFYTGNKRKLPLHHVPEYTANKQHLPCDANYALKELTVQSLNPTVNQYPNILGGNIRTEDVDLGRNKSLTSNNQKIPGLLINTSKQNKHISNLRKLIDSSKINELFSYLADMLDIQILKSFTFIILSVACFVNMFVFLVPFHYLPLLLQYGGLECHFNSLWCPNGLFDENKYNRTLEHTPDNQFHQLIVEYINSLNKDSAFASSEFLFFTIGCASILGRLFAGLYIEKGLNTNRKFLRRCPIMVDPMLLNNAALFVCGLSVISFPLAIHGILLPVNTDQSSSHRLLQAWSLKFRRYLLYFGGILYGLTNTMSISLRSVILVELFGLRRLTNAFGYLLIFQGLGVICGPPLFGVFNDQACHKCLDDSPFYESIPTQFLSTTHKECTLRLISSFYLCAGLLILSSILFMPLRWLARHDPYRNAYTLQSSIITLDNTPQLDEDTSFSPGLGQFEVYDPQETQTTHVLYEENDPSVKAHRKASK